MCAMTSKTMNTSADAWTAPACQSADFTSVCALVLDTAIAAVSFLCAVDLRLVRIILPARRS